ncbi:TPA: TMF family protein [Pseudomonas aeruginosa]|uniref:TMF family protein n=1 Tax=Pseudomonas aeruginosa TaxID=287 RepID=UPI00068B71B0|nr:TMF family protein [Pseudomonas aeruginosa]
MSSTQHQLIEQCAIRLRGIVEALDNIHDSTQHRSPHRWSTDLDDVHSSAESLLALIKDQAPTQASPKCSTCGGTGMVDDGEIDCYSDGTPFENGPVKCVKDCPDCKAQPSPAPELAERGTQHRFSTTEQTCRHDFAGVWWNDNGETKTGKECRECGFFIADIAEAPELERPEVVGYLATAEHPKHGQPHKAFNYFKDQHDAQVAHWRERGCEVSEDELMTVARHDRIVGALRAENAKLSEALDRWPLIRDSLKLRLADALARVAELESKLAELEKQEPVARIAFYEGSNTPVLVGWAHMAVGQHSLYATPVAQAGQVPQAWLDVQAERRRQITAEGWTPEHDDEHDSGELAAAGAAYALHAADHLNPYSQGDGGDEAPSCWPWHDGIAGRGEGPEKTEPAWWKPSTPRRDLVKACALALAEIERLDRAAATQGGPSDA